MKKQYLIISLAVVLGSSIMTAQAGTTHSLGGHGMVNARNYSATHNLGGHNFGGHREGGQSKYQGKIAEYIRAHGGTININKDGKAGAATINVTTGKGGTFSSSINQLREHDPREMDYAYSTTISSAKGKSYSGAGQANIHKDLNNNTFFEASHNGIINGSMNLGATSALSLTKDSNTFVHNNYTADSSWKDYHSSSTTMMKDENGKMINHSESVDITGLRGNNLKTYTETTINKAIDSGMDVTHPNADSQYVLFNDHTIPHVSPNAHA
jgi:hypothetical protein